MATESMLLVRPEHLNHRGYLFGGRLLEWLDEQAYIAVISRMRPGVSLVTVAIDRVEFRHQVREGAVLRIRSQVVHTGRTSVTVYTSVERARDPGKIFRGYVTFVALDADGKPCPVEPSLLRPFKPETDEQRRHWQEVEAGRTKRRTLRLRAPQPRDSAKDE